MVHSSPESKATGVFPGVRHFRQDGCLSYIVYDRATREAVILDPHVAAMESYRDFLMDGRLKLKAALDTHLHCDHPSATHLLKSEFGCEIAMARATESSRPTLKLKTGDSIQIGAFALQAIEAPGRTHDGLALAIPGAVFTGDTLLIGRTGRVDAPTSSADELWASLHERLQALPDSTVVFPAHDFNQFVFSTLGVERRRNEEMLLDRESFTKKKQADVLENPALHSIREIIDFNLQQNPSTPINLLPTPMRSHRLEENGAHIASISIEKYASKLKEKARDTHEFIDVRETGEYVEGHIPGVRNIPLAELGFHLGELKPGSRIYVSCLAGIRSTMAARTLDYLGYTNVVNVTGGFKAWESSGLPIER